MTGLSHLPRRACQLLVFRPIVKRGTAGVDARKSFASLNKSQQSLTHTVGPVCDSRIAKGVPVAQYHIIMGQRSGIALFRMLCDIDGKSPGGGKYGFQLGRGLPPLMVVLTAQDQRMQRRFGAPSLRAGY